MVTTGLKSSMISVSSISFCTNLESLKKFACIDNILVIEVA